VADPFLQLTLGRVDSLEVVELLLQQIVFALKMKNNY